MFDDPVLLPDGYQISIPDRQPINCAPVATGERTGVAPHAAGGDDPLSIASTAGSAEVVRMNAQLRGRPIADVPLHA
jgi:hypothetical protein